MVQKNLKMNLFVLNPDTLWSTPYLKEIQNLEKLFYEKNKASLLLVDKNLSEDKSFQGDFNLEKIVSLKEIKKINLYLLVFRS